MTSRGRPSLYYNVRDIMDLFKVARSTVYRKPEEWGGRGIAGCLRFPRALVDNIMRKDGAIESEQPHR